MSELVSIEMIREAAARVRRLARVTPLVEADDLERRPPAVAEVREPPAKRRLQDPRRRQHAAAVAPDARARGVVTYSSGNHGLAMSLAARELGCPAVIVMPETAPAVKVEGARLLGAEIIFEGTTTVHRKARAEAEAAARGLTMVPPFDHPWIVAGQGTLGLEILEQCPNAATVVVPASGGGLVAGVATAIKALTRAVRIVAVEPAVTPRMTRSLEAGQAVTVAAGTSIADGLLAVRPGTVTLAHVAAFVERSSRSKTPPSPTTSDGCSNTRASWPSRAAPPRWPPCARRRPRPGRATGGRSETRRARSSRSSAEATSRPAPSHATSGQGSRLRA